MNSINYLPHEIQLANEIARTLNDPEALPLYLKYARRYKEEFLRSRLERVMKVDQKKIRTSRGALFTYLINQAFHDPRNSA
jgi:hypothetical protein